MYMFAINNQGTVDYRCLADTRIYYMKIWRDNNLIRFYIPVLHYINGQYTPCFYDKVNDTYIYNLGTDTPTYKISGDYLLDYLGAQPETEIPTTANVALRYDTGVITTTSLATDVKFRLVYGRENFVFGTGTSGSTTPTWQQYSLCCPGNYNRLTYNFGSRSQGAISTNLVMDSSTVVEVNKCSAFFDEGKGRTYFNDTLVFQTDYISEYLSSNTIHLFNRHGDSTNINSVKGSRIYYINFTTSNIPTKTYVPVLHNNQAAFLDLNSGNYIYNIGTSAPYYNFQK